ncbi:MAG: secretin N-terminal domain-containing protein [Candidatus Berkiella sp.]
MKNTAYFITVITIVLSLFAFGKFAQASATPATSATPAPAQSALQTAVITLNNRAPQDVINALTPFLEKGGQIKAFENQLIIQSTASNIEALKAIIAKIDVAPTKLMITVSNGHDKPSEITSISPNGTVTFGDEPNGPHNLDISTTRESDTQVSSVPVDSGNVAFIKTGVTIPLIQEQYAGGASYQRDAQISGQGGLGGSFNGEDHARGVAGAVDNSYEYKNLANGFYVKPQIVGKDVKLELSTMNDQPTGTIGDTTQAAYTTFKAQTVITVPMSKWTYLGGNESQDRSNSTTTYHTRSRDTSQKSLWLRVDLVPE